MGIQVPTQSRMSCLRPTQLRSSWSNREILGVQRVGLQLLCSQNPMKSFPGSPFRVPVKDVVDPSKVKIAGPGLGSGVRACIPQSFTVDTSKAGLAPLEVRVLGPRGEYAPCLPTDIHLLWTGTTVTQSGLLCF